MDTAILTIAYNEEEWIAKCIKQFKPFKLRHLVLVSIKPWNGKPITNITVHLAKKAGAEIIKGFWPNEHEQRNFGLNILRDCDRVLIVDADEFYKSEDIPKLLKNYSEPAGRIKVETFWKSLDYRLDPPDKHEPVVWVNPQKVQFSEHRQIRKFDDKVPEFSQRLMPFKMYHFSWVKSDEKIKEKIQSFSHRDQMDKMWYSKVWKKWKPDMFVRPYGKEKSKAVHNPAPKEFYLM